MRCCWKWCACSPPPIPAALVCGVAALAGLFALERIRRVPGALIVIICGIAASGWLAAHGVALTGPIRLGLDPPRLALPAQPNWPQTIEFALALMFILYAESYSSIRTFALKHDETVQPNRDLVTLGIANVVSGSSMELRSAPAIRAVRPTRRRGAQSRASGLFAAGIILGLVLVCLPFIERIPEPILAAIVIHAVSKSLRLGAAADLLPVAA